MTGALAGIAVEGEQLMRRLTDLDLAALPAAGEVRARPGVRRRRDGEVPDLLPAGVGHYVVEVVRDRWRGSA